MSRSANRVLIGFLVGLALGAPARAWAQGGGERLGGAVRDASGAVIAGTPLDVHLLSAWQSVVAAARADGEGRFELLGVAPGQYELLVTSGQGVVLHRRSLVVPAPGNANLQIVLGLQPLGDTVTITAELGVVRSLDEITQQVNVIGEREIRERAKSVLAQVAQEEPGLQLQRTSPTMGAIFVRGLTGAKVVQYVDGVRFSTAAARGGVNTFFNLNDPANVRAVEVTRGPDSAEFGSDSIGGAVSVVSRAPLLAAGGLALHGHAGTYYNSADHSFGGNTLLSFAGSRSALLASLTSHRSNTIRPGGGFESHSAVTRFLGLRSDQLLGERSTDTAFTRYGGMLKLHHRVTPRDQVSAHYQRSQIDGGKRFDQTLGGDGNLIADLRNFMLDFLYARYERVAAGPFDTLSLSYSYNAQREERVNQGGNGNPLGAITHQPERTAAHGVQAQTVRHWRRGDLVLGADLYRDGVFAPSYVYDPAARTVSPARPRVPDGARYRQGGVYLAAVWSAIPGRLRLVGALRYAAAAYRSRSAYSPQVGGQPLWPDDRLNVRAVTPRVGAALTLSEGVTVSAQVSRGFRAPHITDLGTLGLTGNGYEANAADLSGRGATIGTTAASDAVSSGLPAVQLEPETSWTYEAGLHVTRSRLAFGVNGFVNDLDDNIVLQALILPPGAVGARLGDQVVTSQLASGAVFVPAATGPVLIRSNFGDSRIFGIEQRASARLPAGFTLAQNFTYLYAEDRRTGRPPTIEGGTPAPQGNLRLRYDGAGGRFWVEPYLYGARNQDRLSTLDLEDRRTGAARTRGSIQNFFRRGASERGLVGPGADGRFGTADDLLLATGETLDRVQNRVLGSAASAPLFTSIPGFVTLGIRGGVRLGERQDLTFDLENLNDRNYRGISWGMDGPGRSFGFRYVRRF